MTRPDPTIVAIATPPGSGAIGIVRLSGAEARSVLARLWKSDACPVDKMESRRFYYGKLSSISTGCTVDTVLVVWFQSPNSYTGEEVIEIHAHGNPTILEEILAQCVVSGARVARPGEFTQRAFLNGRIDLSQAEAVADVISARSIEGVRRAQQHLQGGLSRPVRQLLDAVTRLRAFVEASIDFPEEDITLIQAERVAAQVSEIRVHIQQLIATYAVGRLYRHGAQVVLCGLPNAGKSSLLNALCGADRALVHEMAGTTRDTIETVVVWDGIPVHLTDTAGLRMIPATPRGHEAIELLGMERARRAMDAADLRILVIDGSTAIAMSECEILARLPRVRLVVWCNKSDLPQLIDRDDVQDLFPTAHICHGSATQGIGLDVLLATVVRQLRDGSTGDSEGICVTNQRHKEAMDQAALALAAVEAALQRQDSTEFVAEHLRTASDHLGSIIGAVTTEELLGEIFGRFCIGK